MHLVKSDEGASHPMKRVGGFAGALVAWVQALSLGVRMRRKADQQLCVLETLSLGGKKQLVLVRCGGERFLVGTGQDSVQTIVRVQTDDTHGEVLNAHGLGDRL